MKRVPETAAAINAKDPSQLAPALLEVLEVALLPEELPHTRVLIKELLNPKNENEFLQHEIIVLISLAKEKTWLVDIPLWCLSRFLKGPRDDIFSKGLADLHKEVHKTLQENEVEIVGGWIDELIPLQNKNGLFGTIQEAINFAVILQNISCVQLLNELKGKAWSIATIQKQWLESMLKNSITDEKLRQSTQLQNLIKNEKLRSDFLNVDLRIMKDFLENCLAQPEHQEAFEAFLKDYFITNLPQRLWRELFLTEIDGVRVIHGNLIIKKLNLDLKPLCQTEEDDRVLKSLTSTVVELFSEQRWTLAHFLQLLSKVRKGEDLRTLLNLLNIAYESGLDYNQCVFDSLPDAPEEWLKTVTLNIAKYIFSNSSRELSLEELISLIVDSCSNEDLSANQLLQKYREFETEYKLMEGRVALSSLEHQIRNFRKLKAMTNDYMEVHWLEDNIARVAAAAYAVHKFFEVPLRKVQILAILIAINAREKNQGRLLQMQTGEGKTRVIAALAVIEAIANTKVDIVTSSSELAITQFDQLKEFYASVGLTVQHNANNNALNQLGGESARARQLRRLRQINNGGPDIGEFSKSDEAVYKADIVYGAVDDFQADVLHSEFSGSAIRFDRSFDLVIVDEVDSMMIDGRNDSVRLSSKTPGMNDILQIYATIWSQVKNAHANMKEKDGVWYYNGNGEPEEFTGELTAQSFTKNYALSYLRKVLRFDALSKEEVGKEDWDTKVQKEGETNIKPQFPLIEIPEYLRSFVEVQLPKWIDSAVNAMFNMKQGFDYVLKDDNVVVVDAANTGVHHPTMRWSDGLHQFLQMKHGCYLEPEALATNFISKATFFLRYGKNVLGLTGTIGGESSRTFLKSAYDVEFVDIPSFKERRHFEQRPHFCLTEDQWIETIVNTTLQKLESDRAVLIITNYIAYAENIFSKIKIRWHPSRIRLYKDEKGTSVVKEKVKPGECVVATNIAGRGTDLLVTDEVEATGGLHVLLTFLPENDRVERQNIGRTSRTGNRGTSQFILNLLHLPLNIVNELEDGFEASSRIQLLEKLQKTRNSVSLKAAEKAIEEVIKIKENDGAFQQFKEEKKSIMNHIVYESLKKPTNNSLDTMFGMYLRTATSINKESVGELFQNLRNLTYVLKNPYDATAAAKQFYYAGHRDMAKNFYKEAINMDPKFCAAAYYQLGHIAVEEYKSSNNPRFIDEAIENFIEAKKSLELKKLYTDLMIQVTLPEIRQDLSESKEQYHMIDENTILKEQLSRQIILISSIISNIDRLIGRDISMDIKYLEKQLESTNLEESERKATEDQLKMLKEDKQKIEEGVLRPFKRSKADIRIDKKTLAETLFQSEKKNLYEREITQFKEDQFDYTIIVNEKAPINWWAVAAIAGFAMLQIVGGASAAIFSIGVAASVGFAFLQEGVCDLIYAVKNGIMDRNISWTAYGIRKAINLTITVISFGFGALKAAAQGAKEGMKAACKVVTRTATRVAKEGFTLACKAVGIEVTKEVSKVALIKVVDYVCTGTIENSIVSVIKKGVNEALLIALNENSNLQLLLMCDQQSKTNKFGNMFSEKVMRYFEINPGLVEQLKQGAIDILNKSMSKAGYGAEMEVCTKFIKGFEATMVITTMNKSMDYLNKLLHEIVVENKNEIEKNLHQEKKIKSGDYTYSKGTELNPREFLNVLSEKVASILSAQLLGLAQQYVVRQAVNLTEKYSLNLQEEIQKHREKFIDSAIIAENAENGRNAVRNKQNGEEAIDLIKGVAEDTPGDLRQAEYLADVVEQPIIVTTIDENGNEQKHIVGDQYSKKEPIELVYERATDESGVGHYKLADGTTVQPDGENNCLFDAISKKTGYDAALLRKGTANLMLNNFEDVRRDIDSSKFSNLCVGGKANKGRNRGRQSQPQGQRRRSQSAERHTTRINDMNDISRLNARERDSRGRVIPESTGIDYPSDELDTQFHESYVGQHGSQPGNHHTHTLPEPQNIFVREFDKRGNMVRVSYFEGDNVSFTYYGGRYIEPEHLEYQNINRLSSERIIFDTEQNINEPFPPSKHPRKNQNNP